jgi:hypothetical protein
MHPSMCFIGTFPEVGGLVVGGWVSDFEKRAGEVGSPVAGTALMPGTLEGILESCCSGSQNSMAENTNM